jgi:teichuronic acid biosynthesis glycosyltransferase TuaC
MRVPKAGKNMHVLFLSTDYPQNGDAMSGIFIKSHAEALLRNGISVEVIAPVPWVPPGLGRFSQKWKQYRDTPEKYELCGVRIHRPRYCQFPQGDIWASPHRGFTRIIDGCITQTPDVVHAHFAYPPGLAAVKWAKKAGVPCVLSLHGDDVNTFPYISRSCRRRFVTACLGADVLLAVSGALADHTYRMIGIRPQILLIGVNRRLFSSLPDKATARSILQLPSDRPVVAFVGSLLPSKGIRELLEAFRVLAEDGILGVLVGEGPLRPQAERCPSVQVMGLCDNPTVLLYMRAAEVLVLPTYNEGMPTVLVEAGWVGVPIVASAVGGIPELLGEDRGLLIEPKKSDQIIQGIRDVLANPVQARQRSDRLLRHVQAGYDADNNALKLIESYQQVIASAPGAAGIRV